MIEEDSKKKTVIKYRFDAYLMHLIQEVSKRPPAEIVNFFYELTVQICEIGVNNAKSGQRSIRKNVTDYFPGTSIPFHVQVKGWRPYGRYNESSTYTCEAEVGFPEERTYMDEDKLKNIAVSLMEKALLGGDEVIMEDFAKPEIRTPKMYKDLMDAFMARPKQEKKSRKKKEDQDGQTS
jgi:hypothetical protein